MTVKTKTIINSLQELDVLVAQSLGWEKAELKEECSQFTSGAQWQYGSDYYATQVRFFAPDDWNWPNHQACPTPLHAEYPLH
jgi:hypothetical protein